MNLTTDWGDSARENCQRLKLVHDLSRASFLGIIMCRMWNVCTRHSSRCNDNSIYRNNKFHLRHDRIDPHENFVRNWKPFVSANDPRTALYQIKETISKWGFFAEGKTCLEKVNQQPVRNDRCGNENPQKTVELAGLVVGGRRPMWI